MPNISTPLTPFDTTDFIDTSHEFQKKIPVNFPYLLERSSRLIRKILQDMNQWTDNAAHEKLLLRLSFDLVERFLDYCPSQLPCRPFLILDGFVSDYFGRSQEIRPEPTPHPLLYTYLDGLLNRSVTSRDGLICLFYHFYGMKPVEIGVLLGLEDGQIQRIYKNFARWRTKGWQQAIEDTGLSGTDLQKLADMNEEDFEKFNERALGHLERLTPFYRKSEPAYYPCLDSAKWEEMFHENYGLDYRTWHLPFCLPCMKTVMELGIFAFSYDSDGSLAVHLFPHSLKYDGNTQLVGGNKAS